MQYIYPALFKANDDGIIVTFPDLEDTFTDGETMQEAFENAEDVLNLMLWNREEENGRFLRRQRRRKFQCRGKLFRR